MFKVANPSTREQATAVLEHERILRLVVANQAIQASAKKIAAAPPVGNEWDEV